MILQQRDGMLLFFRQTDHALLSGAFADLWGNEHVPAPPRREQTLVAASRHDDGWAEWELAPRLRSDGEPVDFIRVPVAEHVPLYRRGIDLVEHEDDFAGLVASKHGQRLYTRPFHPGMDPRIQHLHGQDLELAQAYVDHETKRQDRIVAALGPQAETDSDEAWRMLQVWDRLSLLVCMQDVGSAPEQRFPPIAGGEGDIQIAARGGGEGTLVLDPYPFSVPRASFDIAYVSTDRTSWPDEASFRRDFRSARRDTLRFRCTGS